MKKYKTLLLCLAISVGGWMFSEKIKKDTFRSTTIATGIEYALFIKNNGRPARDLAEFAKWKSLQHRNVSYETSLKNLNSSFQLGEHPRKSGIWLKLKSHRDPSLEADLNRVINERLEDFLPPETEAAKVN